MQQSLAKSCRQQLLHRDVPRALRSSARKLVSDTSASSLHSSYLIETANVEAPPRLPSMLRVLQTQGHTIVGPSERSALHPWLIPLSERPDTRMGSDESLVTALLRWPDQKAHRSMPLPVVSMARGARGMTLVARSVDEYLHRAIAEEDQKEIPDRPIASASGPDGATLYEQGDVHGHAGKFELYLIRKIGMFPDVCETLAFGHLDRGDATSALVACEWYMRSKNFPSWGRPYEFAAELFARLKREEEARDTARVALRNPWWTLTSGYDAAQELAQLHGTPEEVRYQLSEEAAAAAAAQYGTKVDVDEPKTPAQVALDSASRLLDMVAAGRVASWDEARPDLSALYLQGGLSDMAAFVKL